MHNLYASKVCMKLRTMYIVLTQHTVIFLQKNDFLLHNRKEE